MATTKKIVKQLDAKATTDAKPKATSAFMKPVNISPALAAVIGPTPLPRTEVTKKLWAYIKEHKLQGESDKRSINADEKLLPVFGGKKVVSMFEMTKLVSAHLS